MNANIAASPLALSPEQRQYLKQRKKQRLTVLGLRLLLLVGFLFFWEIAARLGWIDSFFFSSPAGILSLFLTMCRENTLWGHIGVTLLETLVSFTAVTVLSILIALLFVYFPRCWQVFEPALVVLNSLPKSALAPLFIVWLGTGMNTIVIAGMSVALFGSIINMYIGFSQVDEEKIKLIYTLGGRPMDALEKVILPASLPIMLSNMKVNIGLCLVGVVIGEFLAARQGLGYLIIYGSQVFQLDLLILSILLLCLIATVLYQFIGWLEKRFS